MVDRSAAIDNQNFNKSIDYSKKVIGQYPKSKWVDDAYLLWARSLLGKEDPRQTVTMLQDFGRALAKAHLGSGEPLPAQGTVFLSLRDDDKRAIIFMAKKLVELGYGLIATRGTARFLRRSGVPCREVFKVHEGRPNAVDLIEAGEIQLVINTPLGRVSEYDEKAIRARALSLGVPVITTIAGALAAVSGLEALRRGPLEVAALQEGR